MTNKEMMTQFHLINSSYKLINIYLKNYFKRIIIYLIINKYI